MKVPGELGKIEGPRADNALDGKPRLPAQVEIPDRLVWNYQQINSSFVCQPATGGAVSVAIDPGRFGPTLRVSVGHTLIVRGARDTRDIQDEWLRQTVEYLLTMLAAIAKRRLENK